VVIWQDVLLDSNPDEIDPKFDALLPHEEHGFSEELPTARKPTNCTNDGLAENQFKLVKSGLQQDEPQQPQDTREANWMGSLKSEVAHPTWQVPELPERQVFYPDSGMAPRVQSQDYDLVSQAHQRLQMQSRFEELNKEVQPPGLSARSCWTHSRHTAIHP
jgi:hypothetical protein